MKALMTTATALILTCSAVAAQDVPNFVKDTFPDYAIDQAAALMGALEGEHAAIDKKSMNLIQLGVAAQIPCQYCIYYHTRAAMSAGATEAEIKAAIAAAADVRLFSTVLNGNQYDLATFRAEVDDMMPSN